MKKAQYLDEEEFEDEFDDDGFNEDDYCPNTGELKEDCWCDECIAEMRDLAGQQEAHWAHLDGIDFL